MSYNLVTILGPTASGKTLLAAHLASQLGSAVIGADSRQVYKGMDIGTGKDFNDYVVNGIPVNYYLVDICNAGEKYNVFEYQKDFIKIFIELSVSGRVPILCGGSGLYIEAVLKAYRLISVPINISLRKKLNLESDVELEKILGSFRKLHNTTDTVNRKRLTRAIEIEEYQKINSGEKIDYPQIESLIIGIKFERDELKQRITERLKTRLNSGMIEEVEKLVNTGIQHSDLIYYGLEYKFVTQYILGQISYDEMFNLLNIAIHQFSKRQMTWFRKMEREGFVIHWLNGAMPLDEKVDEVIKLFEK